MHHPAPPHMCGGGNGRMRPFREGHMWPSPYIR
jgi:hypothetical protein